MSNSTLASRLPSQEFCTSAGIEFLKDNVTFGSNISVASEIRNITILPAQEAEDKAIFQIGLESIYKTFQSKQYSLKEIPCVICQNLDAGNEVLIMLPSNLMLRVVAQGLILL